MSDLIQKKIENMEGILYLESLGWITSIEYDNITDPKWDITADNYLSQIENIKKTFQDDPKQYEIEMKKISDEIISKRTATNPNYLKNQKLKIIYQPTKHDYEEDMTLKKEIKDKVEKEK